MPVSLRWLVSTAFLTVNLINLLLLLLPSLCSGNGHLNPPHQQFHGMVVPVYEHSNNQSADKLIIYEVRVNCLKGCTQSDTNNPHCTVQTSHDPPAEAGNFSCSLDAEPDIGEPGGFKAITELEVTVVSVHELGGHHRSHSWKLIPQFNKRHKFNMGFFTPSPEGTPFFLSFQIDSRNPLPDIVIESDGQTPVWKYELIVLRPEKKGSWNRMRKMFVKARIYGSKELAAKEWKSNEEFQVILDKQDKSNSPPPRIDKYLHDYAKPTLELVLRKVPVCEMCLKKGTNSREGAKEEKGQIYKIPPYNNHYHLNCFVKRFPESNLEALLFDKKAAAIEHIYTATLEMPILQNNQAAEIYTYTINTSIKEKFHLDEIVYLSLKGEEEDEKEAEEKKAANEKHEKRNKGDNEMSSSKASTSTGTEKEVPPPSASSSHTVAHHSSSTRGLLAPAAHQKSSAEIPPVKAAGHQDPSHVHNRHQSPSPPTTNAAGMSASAAISISSNLASDSASNNLTNVGSERHVNQGHHHDANAALIEAIILVSGGGTSSRSSLKKKKSSLSPIHEDEEPPEPSIAADDQASSIHPHQQSPPMTNAAGVSNRNLRAFDSNLANRSLANPIAEVPPEPAEKASCCCCGDPFTRMLKKGRREKGIFFDGSIPSGKPSEPTVADTVQVPSVYHQQSSPPMNAARESAVGSSNLASNNSSDNAGNNPPSSLKNKLKKKKPILSIQLPVKGEGNLFRMQREQWERNEEELKREKMRKKGEEVDKLTTILPFVDVESPRLEPMVLPANAAAGEREPLILQEVPLSPSSSPVSSSSNQSSPVATGFAASDDLPKIADDPTKKHILKKEEDDDDDVVDDVGEKEETFRSVAAVEPILEEMPLSPITYWEKEKKPKTVSTHPTAGSSSSSNQFSPVATGFAAPDDLPKTADEPMKKKSISAKEDDDIDEETRLTKTLKNLQTTKEEDRVKKLSMLTDEEQLELATRASLDEMKTAEAKAKNKNVGNLVIKEPSAAKGKAAEKSAGKVLQLPAADPKNKGKGKMYNEDEAHPMEEVREEDTKVSEDAEEEEKKKKDKKEEENNVKRLPPIMEEEEEEEEKEKEERKMVKNPLHVHPKKEEAEEEDDIFFDAPEHLDLHQEVPEMGKAEQSHQKKSKKKPEEEKKETKPKEKKPKEKKPKESEKKKPEESKKKEKKLNTTTSGNNTSKLADVNVEEARGKGIGVDVAKKEDGKIGETSPDEILMLTTEPHFNSEDENDLPPPLKEETYSSDGERRMTPANEHHTNVYLHHDNQREPPHAYWNPFAYTMQDQSLSPPPSNDEHPQNQQDVDEEEGYFERIANFVRPHF